MGIGGSLLLIAVGAILKWAVADHVSGVNLGVIGIILMIVGALGLILSVVLMARRRRTDVVQEGYGPTGTSASRTTYTTPTPYDQP
jgi:hypothetical protein